MAKGGGKSSSTGSKSGRKTSSKPGKAHAAFDESEHPRSHGRFAFKGKKEEESKKKTITKPIESEKSPSSKAGKYGHEKQVAEMQSFAKTAKNERMMIVDRTTGRTVLDKQGQTGHVVWNDRDLPEKNVGQYGFIHNHPKPATGWENEHPSGGDLYVAAKHGGIHTVVGPTRTTHMDFHAPGSVKLNRDAVSHYDEEGSRYGVKSHEMITTLKMIGKFSGFDVVSGPS
jgi:hypothetical protein